MIIVLHIHHNLHSIPCQSTVTFLFDILMSNWSQNQFFCKKVKKYSAENDVFSELFLAKDSTNDTMHPFGLLFYFSFHHLIFKHGNQFIVLMFKFLLIDYLEQHFKIYISKFLVIIY